MAHGVIFLLLAGCGGKEFASGAAPGSGGQGFGGESSSGGVAGESAGAATTGGQGDAGTSSAGTATVGCNCRAGSYCRDGSTDCLKCSELNRFRFHAPERLATLSDSPGARFPRAGGTGTDLLYQYVGVGLRYTTDSSTSAGSNVAQTMPQDAAPLLLPSNVTAPAAEAPFNFVFDRVVEGERRELFFGQWNGGLAQAARAPEPFNDATSSNFGLAIALSNEAPRGYWLTDRYAQVFSLVTATFGDDAAVETVPLALDEPPCPVAADSSLSPWISLDGDTLLFSHAPLNGDCQSAAEQNDIYKSFVVATTGLPPEGSGATPVDDVNSAYDDLDPSLSADACELYFASNRDGEYALYRAHRR